jgi:membrane associated rhomboid family serine protease
MRHARPKGSTGMGSGDRTIVAVDTGRPGADNLMSLTPWVLRLLGANVVVFLLTMMAPALGRSLMFVPALVLEHPWTLVTYMFVHGGIWHIVFNMLALVFFGPRVEVEMGERDFLFLYFISGMTGGLLSFVSPWTPIVGASGALYGVMMAYAYFWPRAQIFLWGIFPVEARWLVVFMTALSLYGSFSGTDDIAHFAHLGGFLGGLLFVRWWSRRSLRRSATIPAATALPSRQSLHRWSRIDRNRLHEVNREEYDRIQEKIRSSGAGSLTQGERDFLDRFSPEGPDGPS